MRSGLAGVYPGRPEQKTKIAKSHVQCQPRTRSSDWCSNPENVLIKIEGILEKAAIEFKYAATSEEVARSLRGIFEDVSGYKGSADWTRFYSVVYQTDAFESEEKFRHDLARAGAISWTPILVTGKGRRAKAKTAKKKKSKRSKK